MADSDATESTTSTTDGSRLRTRVPWIVLGLGAIAAAVALLSRANLAPLGSGDSDEAVYKYQARMLTQGHATLAASVHGTFFHPWLFGQRGTRLFPQYQPGWPSVIAFAHVLGDERLAIVIAAVAAVLATWFLAQQVAPGSGVYAAALLLLSPIFIVHAGLYLAYLWTAALVAAGMGCVIAGVRTTRPLPFVGAGALFGGAVLTRPFDAALVAVLAGIYMVVALASRPRDLGRAALWTALGGLPFALFTVVYDAAITGNPLRFPLQAADSRDTFGFGLRAGAPYSPEVLYTKHLALQSLTKNVDSMPHWFAGGGLGLALALAAVFLHRRRRETWLLVAAVAVFPLGYFFWWATALSAKGAAKGLGPHYYIPAFLFLAVLGGLALQDLAQRSRLLVGVGLVAVAAGSLFMAPTVLRNAHVTTRLERAVARPLTSPRLKNAVVVMRADPSRYTLLSYPFLVGDPRLHDNVLYAVDRGPASAELATLFPTRRLYQFVQRTEPGHDILRPSYIVEPLRVVNGSTVRLRFVTTNPGRWPVVSVAVKVGGHTVATQTLTRDSTRGANAPFSVVLGAPGANLPSPAPGLLVAPVKRDGQVAVDVAFGPHDRADRRADVYGRRYFVAVHPNTLSVQLPGLQYHRFNFGKTLWIRENIDATLAEGPH